VIFVIFLLAGRNPHVIRKGIYAEIDQKIRAYISTKVALSLVTGILVWGILGYFGLKFAGMFGLLAFMMNFIPSIGSVIATLLPIPVAFVQFRHPETGLQWAPLLGVILWPGAVQMLIGNVIEPKLMGKGLELHPVTIVLMLAFWGLLWGAIGAILAVPMTAVLRIVLMRFDAGKPIGRLLAGELPGSTVAEGA
jgi:AI-2 transport protein TqsA